ncbi:hypothetical protein ACFYSF_04955 [Streptomyces canus]|uniref:hypothetical protein n=1 Tax=Streptomyces canus TaxID=58343 RepID=UPI00367FFCB2
MDFLTGSTAPWWFASVAALVGWAAGDWLRGRRDAKERKRVELNRAVTDFLGASARIMEARMNSADELGGPGDQAALISARDSIRLVAGPAVKEAADNVMKATAVRWSEDLTKRDWVGVMYLARDELIETVDHEVNGSRRSARGRVQPPPESDPSTSDQGQAPGEGRE